MSWSKEVRSPSPILIDCIFFVHVLILLFFFFFFLMYHAACGMLPEQVLNLGCNAESLKSRPLGYQRTP